MYIYWKTHTLRFWPETDGEHAALSLLMRNVKFREPEETGIDEPWDGVVRVAGSCPAEECDTGGLVAQRGIRAIRVEPNHQ